MRQIEAQTGRTLRAISDRFEAREDGGEKIIEGYFAVYGSDYEIYPGMTESIAPGAFGASLAGDVRMLCNHDTTLVLGRTSAGTLEIREDAHGVWARAKINPHDSEAVNTHARVMRHDVNGGSIGFTIKNEEYSTRADGTDHWTITEAELFEVSVCTFPAYTETDVSARCADRDAVKKQKREAWKTEMMGRLKKCR